MKKGDWLLIGGVLLLAGAALIWMQLTKVGGSQVVIRIDGRVTETYDLAEDRTVILEGVEGRHNTLVIQNGKALFAEADCPDLLCVHQGEVSYDGQTIVCLPNRVVAEIQGGEVSSVDEVAR